MDASKIASAYLNSLVHTPRSHLFSLDSEPLPKVVLTDLSVWLEGFRCGDLRQGTGRKLPLAHEVFVWVDLALQRYFHEVVPALEAEPLKLKAQAAAATPSEEKQRPVKAAGHRTLGVPILHLGIMGALNACATLI